MIDFLAGLVTLGHLVAAILFCRLWLVNADRLYAALAAAFALFALNQALAAALVGNEFISLVHALRILGFVVVIAAMIDREEVSSPSASARSASGK